MATSWHGFTTLDTKRHNTQDSKQHTMLGSMQHTTRGSRRIDSSKTRAGRRGFRSIVTSACTVVMVVAAAFLLAGCAAHNSLEPIGGGNTELSVSAGYPFYPVAEVRHGVTDWLDMSIGGHAAPLLEGGWGADAVVAVFPFGTAPEDSWRDPTWAIRPTVGLQAGISMIDVRIGDSDVWDSLFDGDSRWEDGFYFVRFTPTLAWPTQAGALYFGTDFGYVETPWEQGDRFLFWHMRDPDPFYLVNPFLGHRFQVNPHLAFVMEGKALLAPGQDVKGTGWMGFLGLNVTL